jgi:hypothetical protein
VAANPSIKSAVGQTRLKNEISRPTIERWDVTLSSAELTMGHHKSNSVSIAAPYVPTSNTRESLWLRTEFLSIEDGIVEVVLRDHFKQARDKFGLADADGFRTLAQP